jgi:hypothetical protein
LIKIVTSGYYLSLTSLVAFNVITFIYVSSNTSFAPTSPRLVLVPYTTKTPVEFARTVGLIDDLYKKEFIKCPLMNTWSIALSPSLPDCPALMVLPIPLTSVKPLAL